MSGGINKTKHMPSIDIEIDDFLTECSSYEIKNLIKYLIEDGYDEEILNELNRQKKLKPSFYSNKNIDESLIKIQNSHIQLTLEEEQQIYQIANRLV